MTGTCQAFDDLRHWIGARTGLSVTPDRRASIDLVIARALARAGVGDDVREYRRRLEADEGALDDLLAELTIGETYFFREPAQFQFIRQTILPEIRQRCGPDQILRAWSAGCASGEEAYSLAIVFLEEGLADRVQLLATDLSRATLAKARQGLYGDWSLRGAGAEAARPYLRRQGNRYVVADCLRRLITFEPLNLARDDYPAPATGVWKMDLILCRNVLIYFDRETVRTVARRLYESLADGGWLITASTDPPLTDAAPFEVVATDQGIFYRRGIRPASDGHPCLPVTPERDTRPTPTPQEGEALREGEAPAEPALVFTERRPPTADHARAMPTPPASPRAGPRDLTDAADVALRIRALANRDAAEAERLCAAAMQRHPLSSELPYLRAVLLLDLGRDEEALRAARRAIFLDRSLAVAHLTLGSILERRGDRAGAWRAYRNARDLCRARPAAEIVPLSEGEPAGRLAAAAEAQMARIEAQGRERR